VVRLAGLEKGERVANEILQWTVLTVLAFLLLGALRQISLMLPTPSRTAVGGPAVGRQLPTKALRELRHTIPPRHSMDGALIVFVTEGCTGCQQLLRTLETSRPGVDGQTIVLVAKKPTPAFRGALDAMDMPVIHDDSGEVWNACGITATPLVVRIDAQGRVAAKEVTHDVERVAAPAEAEQASSGRR
jgi:hypothetical protein